MKTRTILALIALVCAGLGVRTLPQKLSPELAAWWPWTTTTVTLHFSDGRFIVPVSRRMTRNTDLPRATLEALLAGPTARSGLKNPVPAGVGIRSFELQEGVAHVERASAALLERSQTQATTTAIIATMTALAGGTPG